ncbi:unnamed protein product, partial [Urochloa humidicola]
ALDRTDGSPVPAALASADPAAPRSLPRQPPTLPQLPPPPPPPAPLASSPADPTAALQLAHEEERRQAWDLCFGAEPAFAAPSIGDLRRPNIPRAEQAYPAAGLQWTLAREGSSDAAARSSPEPMCYRPIRASLRRFVVL